MIKLAGSVGVNLRLAVAPGVSRAERQLKLAQDCINEQRRRSIVPSSTSTATRNLSFAVAYVDPCAVGPRVCVASGSLLAEERTQRPCDVAYNEFTDLLFIITLNFTRNVSCADALALQVHRRLTRAALLSCRLHQVRLNTVTGASAVHHTLGPLPLAFQLCLPISCMHESAPVPLLHSAAAFFGRTVPVDT